MNLPPTSCDGWSGTCLLPAGRPTLSPPSLKWLLFFLVLFGHRAAFSSLLFSRPAIPATATIVVISYGSIPEMPAGKKQPALFSKSAGSLWIETSDLVRLTIYDSLDHAELESYFQGGPVSINTQNLGSGVHLAVCRGPESTSLFRIVKID